MYLLLHELFHHLLRWSASAVARVEQGSAHPCYPDDRLQQQHRQLPSRLQPQHRAPGRRQRQGQGQGHLQPIRLTLTRHTTIMFRNPLARRSVAEHLFYIQVHFRSAADRSVDDSPFAALFGEFRSSGVFASLWSEDDSPSAEETFVFTPSLLYSFTPKKIPFTPLLQKEKTSRLTSSQLIAHPFFPHPSPVCLPPCSRPPV